MRMYCIPVPMNESMIVCSCSKDGQCEMWVAFNCSWSKSGEVTLTWLLVGRVGWLVGGLTKISHSTSYKPTASCCSVRLNKKATPRVKKPGTKPSGPSQGRVGGTLYAETIQMCGYNMSTAPPSSNLSSLVASKSESLRLEMLSHSVPNFIFHTGPSTSDICIGWLAISRK